MIAHSDSRRLRKLISSAAFGVLILFSVRPVFSYSILTHEAIIDTAWDSAIKPLLLKRFPASTVDESDRSACIRLRRKHHSGFGLLPVWQ